MAHQPHTSVCFVAGRSGGHIVPALTLAEEHKKNYPHAHIIFITANTTLDKKITDNHPVIDHAYYCDLAPFPGKAVLKYPYFCMSLTRSVWHCIRILRRHNPQKIISTGGYIALPVCLAAKLLRIPIELYELNALPGIATRALAPLATTVACCFKEAFPFFSKKKVRYAPYPIRFSRSAAASTSLPPYFSPTRKTILVIGGSQGSHFINTAINTWLAQTACIATVQIIHQTGITHLQTCRDFYALHTIPALVFDYDDRIEQYYRCADLVICRSGAGSLFETIFFNKPCITIPLETKSTDHQIYNARACARTHPNLVSVIAQQKLAQEPLLLDNFVQSL